MKLFWRFIRTDIKKSKRNFALFGCTIFLGVIAIVISLLLTRTGKLLYADTLLSDYGNYDVAFCQVSDKLKDVIEKDNRFSELGYVFDQGKYRFLETGNSIEVGAVKDQKTEDMYYVNPVKGRYPNKKGEICIDRITLKSNGLAEKLGQKIQLTCDDTSENVTYTLVGIIEVQKHDTGETYDTRFYPEEMFSTSNMNNVNFPYAYIYPEEVKNPKGIHILADVVKKENSANVVQSYLDDSDLLSDLHITTDRSFGREWTIANILGADTNGDSLANVVSSSMENGNISVDGYTKYLMPVLLLLIFTLVLVGIFDSIRMDIRRKYDYYGTLLRLGMNSKKIALFYSMEMLIVLAVTILAGIFCGKWGYEFLISLANDLLNIHLLSVVDFDSFYIPYINKVTWNPYTTAAFVVGVSVVVATIINLVQLIRMKPIQYEMKKVTKKKRKFECKNLYYLLNHYMGIDKIRYRILPNIIICLVLVSAVFGYQFFQCKIADDTGNYDAQLKEARIKGFDYYMKQSPVDVYSGYLQYMHNSGVTTEMFQELKSNENVKSAKGAIVDYSTALVVNKTDMLSNKLMQQSEVSEAISDSVNDQIDALASVEYLKYLGVDLKKKQVFHTPTIGLSTEEVMSFAKNNLIAGEIDRKKIETGEEVLLMVTDQDLASYFKVGDKLPLVDFIRDKTLDESTECMLGQIPKGYENQKSSYKVTVQNVTKEFLCFEKMIPLDARIGGIVLVDADLDSFYFEDDNGVNTVNVLTSTDAFTKWKLPNKNYTRVGVTLKKYNDTALKSFDKTWSKYVSEAKYMAQIDVFSILREKQMISKRVMAIFYLLLAVLILLSILSAGNTISMNIFSMKKERMLLNDLGMTKRKIRLLLWMRFGKIGLFGGCISILPVWGYSRIAAYANDLMRNAYENDTYDALILSKPWVEAIPKYDLWNGNLLQTVLVSVAVSLLIIGIIVIICTCGQKEGRNKCE